MGELVGTSPLPGRFVAAPVRYGIRCAQSLDADVDRTPRCASSRPAWRYGTVRRSAPRWAPNNCFFHLQKLVLPTESRAVESDWLYSTVTPRSRFSGFGPSGESGLCRTICVQRRHTRPGWRSFRSCSACPGRGTQSSCTYRPDRLPEIASGSAAPGSGSAPARGALDSADWPPVGWAVAGQGLKATNRPAGAITPPLRCRHAAPAPSTSILNRLSIIFHWFLFHLNSMGHFSKALETQCS